MESHFKCSLPAILQPVEWSPFDICGTIEAISFESPQVHISEFLGFRLPTWIECYSMSWCIFYFARPWLIGINVSFDYDEIFIKWKLHSNFMVWVCSYNFSNLLICGLRTVKRYGFNLTTIRIPYLVFLCNWYMCCVHKRAKKLIYKCLESRCPMSAFLRPCRKSRCLKSDVQCVGVQCVGVQSPGFPEIPARMSAKFSCLLFCVS